MTPLITHRLPIFSSASLKALTKSKLALALIVSLTVWAQGASADVIIYDTFTAPDLTLPTNPSHNPNINTTGNGGYVIGTATTNYNAGVYSGSINGIIRNFSAGGGETVPNGTYAQFGGFSSLAISLSGSTAAGYNLSADLSPANSNSTGIALGFFSSAPNAYGTSYYNAPGYSAFSGLSLVNNGGYFDGDSHQLAALTLIVNGVTVESFATSRLTNNYSQLSNLNFTINTTTGALTGVTLITGATTDHFSFTTDTSLVFNLANLNYVGLGTGSPGSGSTQGGTNDYYANSLFATNLTVESIPEPSTLAMLGLGLAGFILLRKVSRLKMTT